MKKIEIYGTYAFDILNKLRIKENGTYSVQVLEIKRRFLRKPLYRVVSLQTGRLFLCEKKYLTPIPASTEMEVFIRYPDYTPTIIDRDVETINKVIARTDANDPNYANLCKLQTKLDFYSKVRYI